MISKLFVFVTALVLPLVFAATIVFGQTPTTNPTTGTTTNTTNTTSDDAGDSDTTIPSGAPRTGFGGLY